MIINTKSKSLNEKLDVDNEFKLQEQTTDSCAMNKLDISENIDSSNTTHSGEIHNDYDLGI